MNVLFIVADDLNSWIGALGRHPDVRTPNIDALAARGTLFTHAYRSAPYCNASRMGVLTGRLPTTTGIYANEPLSDAPARPAVFIETLKAAGYHTFGAGKVLHGTFDYTSATGERALQAEWREVQNRPFLWDEFHTNATDPLPPERPVNGLFTPEQFEEAARAYHVFDWGPLPDAAAESLPDSAVVEAVADFLSSNPPVDGPACSVADSRGDGAVYLLSGDGPGGSLLDRRPPRRPGPRVDRSRGRCRQRAPFVRVAKPPACPGERFPPAARRALRLPARELDPAAGGRKPARVSAPGGRSLQARASHRQDHLDAAASAAISRWAQARSLPGSTTPASSQNGS
jgi:hypothetical protein